MSTPEVQSPHTLLRSKEQSITRFTRIIQSLAQIYQLPLQSLHIFYDEEGGVIAFNRNASLFLNLRYWESWRTLSLHRTCYDADSIRRWWDRKEWPSFGSSCVLVYIYSPYKQAKAHSIFARYFTLAHEIAHNLVQPHNSEHEFYFSAICEKHIAGLGKLLGSAGYFK